MISRRRRKGQAAIEFMTTYGWALMAIAITIGALSYFDLLDVNRYTTTGCSTGAQLECIESTISQTGTFQINLRNNYPVDITINDINLTDNQGKSYNNTVNTNILRGQKVIFPVNNIDASSKGSKMDFTVRINFSRVSVGNSYIVLGSTTVKVTD